ncbi:hypothetical protein CEXT_268161 [Caerostris extrusa]|uniref:Uncharacterized protein n=1 Tax=Caerostris extrusa TaxID=172846 RepID=A0AAV4W7L0_CAEEX|nr:hypothetical protein CEXT_268161 [Caerostris extrusa]
MQHLFPPSGALLPTDQNNPFQNMSAPLRNRTSLKWWKNILRHDYGLYKEILKFYECDFDPKRMDRAYISELSETDKWNLTESFQVWVRYIWCVEGCLVYSKWKGCSAPDITLEDIRSNLWWKPAGVEQTVPMVNLCVLVGKWKHSIFL